MADLNREDPTPTPKYLRIIPDDQNNSILAYGTDRELGTIEAMLRKIDILPLQVRIDAVIAEVTLNDNLQYGTQFFFQAGGINSVLSNSTQPAVAPAASKSEPEPSRLHHRRPRRRRRPLRDPGFAAGHHRARALLAGTPRAGQPASRLAVGNVVPYLSQTSQSTLSENAPIVSSINYQQTGVIMQVTPRVNSGGLVTLDVMQDVSNVVTGLTTPGVNSPTFDERNVTSRVVVQDGQTIGLAGLITDNTSKGNQGIPWLKDVPILGLLAGTQNNTRQRTELLILITPHVIHDQRDARALTDDLREQLINAAASPTCSTICAHPARLTRQPGCGRS